MGDSLPLLQQVAGLRRNAAALARTKLESQDIDITQSEAYYEACQGITSLKARNREVFLSSEAKRQKVAQASSTGDAHSLTLQNLLYEKEHLQREIDKERAYPTVEFDRIVLVPVEQLDQDAPEVRSQAAAEGGSDARKHEHALTLGRLKHERELRLQLEAQLTAAKQKLAALRSGTRAKVALIDSFPSLADRIKATAEPLAVALGLEPGGQQARYARAYGLPGPLYTLFSLFDAVRATMAYNPAYGPVQLPAPSAAATAADVASTGAGAGTAPGAPAAATTTRVVPLSSVSVDVVDAISVELPPSLPAALRTGVYPVPHVRYRMHAQALGLTLGGQPGGGSEAQQAGFVYPDTEGGRPAKRARMEGVGSSSSAASEGGTSSAQIGGGGGGTGVSLQALLSPHPKALVLMVQAGAEGGPACSLRFQYLPLLDAVTVCSTPSTATLTASAVATLLAEGRAGGTPARLVHLSDAHLQAVVPGDGGDHVQAWTAALSTVAPVAPTVDAQALPGGQAAGEGQAGLTRAPFPLAAVGHRPYFWAQALAGLHTLPPQELVEHQQLRSETHPHSLPGNGGSAGPSAGVRLPSAKALVDALAAACLAA